MRVIGVNFYNNVKQKVNSFPVQKSANLNTGTVDSVSFSGTSRGTNSYLLKALLPYRIPDFYSDIILMDSKAVSKMLSDNVFNKSIKVIGNVIGKYEDSLFPVKKQVAQMISEEAKNNPRMKLDEFINSLLPSHNKVLRDIQRPIFEELDDLASGLPFDVYEQYRFLRFRTDKKLLDEPVFEPFSLKAFRYKLSRIKERIDRSGNNSEKSAINHMSKMAEFPHIPKYITNSKTFHARRIEEKKANILLNISDFFERSVLKNDEDLKSLIKTSRTQVYKIPTDIKFNRKSFIYDVRELVDDESRIDPKLTRLILNTASHLPTSKENLSAFILKSATRSPEQIGYDLFSGSVGSADHLVAAKHGGKSDISNYVLASSYKNSEKAHRKFSKILRENPEQIRYAQNHFERLIELANSGIFRKIGLSTDYIRDLTFKINKLSPQNTPLNIDTSKLKY